MTRHETWKMEMTNNGISDDSSNGACNTLAYIIGFVERSTTIVCDLDRFVYRWMTPINLDANKMHWKSLERFGDLKKRMKRLMSITVMQWSRLRFKLLVILNVFVSNFTNSFPLNPAWENVFALHLPRRFQPGFFSFFGPIFWYFRPVSQFFGPAFWFIFFIFTNWSNQCNFFFT